MRGTCRHGVFKRTHQGDVDTKKSNDYRLAIKRASVGEKGKEYERWNNTRVKVDASGERKTKE